MKFWLKLGLNNQFLFGLTVLFLSSFMILLASEQIILPFIYILLFSMTYFLFVEFKSHEMISYKTTSVFLMIIFGYIMSLLNQDQPILYFGTFIIPFFFLLSLNNKIFYTSIITNSLFHITLFILSIHSGILKEETVIKENSLLNLVAFLSIQSIFIYLHHVISDVNKNRKLKEDILTTETTELETNLHNLYFSKNKTSEITYHFHQFIHNLDKTKDHYHDFLNKFKTETLKSKKNEIDINYLLDKMLDSLDTFKDNLENEQSKILKYQKDASRNLSNSHEEIKTIENMQEVNNDNELNLNTSIDSISTIHSLIELIRGISNQINLLSLNASIEASKSGEAGKQFSVIAKEIKHLQIEVLDTLTDITNEISTIEHSFNSLKEGNRKLEKKTDILLEMKNITKETNQEINEFIKNHLVSNEIKNQKISIIYSDINNSLKKINDVVESTTIVEDELEESFVIFNQQKKLTLQLKSLLLELQKELTKTTNTKEPRKN